MKIFDRYLFSNLVVATLFIAVILALLVFLTQSLRFLELVLKAGTSGSAFWVLTMLALPRFFEVILPVSIMAATLFIYNKMTMDSEITVMRTAGYSAFSLARPTLVLAGFMTLLLWVLTFWVTPLSLAQMQQMRSGLTSEFSTILFREGVFNQVGKGLTVYIKERTPQGELAGLMIHDTRDEAKLPSTVLAKRGQIMSAGNLHQVIVYDGSRQEFSPESGILQRLAFERYTIDLPRGSADDVRWSEPEERTISQLLSPDLKNDSDIANLREFRIEIHRRIAAPLMALVYPLIALSMLLIGSVERRGQSRKIGITIVAVMILQGFFLATQNLAKNTDAGIILMYVLTFAPMVGCLFALSGASESLRYTLLRALQNKAQRANS